MYTPIESFGWDQDGYGVEPSFVYVYLMSGFDGVGKVKDRVSCEFTPRSFDLKVMDFGGKNWRLFKNNLEHSIVPADSKVIVKKNSIKIKLLKAKGQYGEDHWTELSAKRPRFDADGKKKEPGDSIMDMMKDMYDNGDDTMKKTLGEAMLKSRQENAMNGRDAEFGGDPMRDTPLGGIP